MSAVAGLGAVPDTWAVVPARRFLRLQTRPVQQGDEVVTAFRDGVVTRRSARRLEGFTESIKEIGYQHVEPGDLVVHSMDGFAGAIGVSDSRGKMSPVANIYSVDGDSRFTAYMLRTLASSGYVAALAKGIRERSTSFDHATIAGLQLPQPRLEEQRRIADFLDDRVARIDQIITARRAQVASAREMVSTAMTQATTPRAGEAAVWRLTKFNHVARVNDGLVDPSNPRFADMALVAPNHIEKRTGRLLELVSAKEQGVESGKGYVRSGQVIYSKIRPGLRKATVAPMDVLCSADAYGLEANHKLMTPAFLLATVLGDYFSQQAVEMSDRVAMPKVNRETLAEISVWVPPLDVQEAAVRTYRRTQEAADRLDTGLNASISVLTEYKQSLITAAVSGEFDVSTAGSGIPG